jgi:hypothetical protein
MTLSVTGLLGTNTSSTSDTLRVTEVGQVRGIFSQTGQWNQSTGSLAFTVLKTTEPHNEYIISFVIQNPLNGQDAPLEVKIAVDQWPMAPFLLNRSTGVETPLLVHSFLWSWLQQNDPGPSANNTFVLELTSRSDLPSSPSEIIVTNPGFDYIAGDLIVQTSIGTGFRAAFDVRDQVFYTIQQGPGCKYKVVEEMEL